MTHLTRETHYAKVADDVHIAYQVVGSGPVDLAMDFHAFAGNVDLILDPVHEQRVQRARDERALTSPALAGDRDTFTAHRRAIGCADRTHGCQRPSMPDCAGG